MEVGYSAYMGYILNALTHAHTHTHTHTHTPVHPICNGYTILYVVIQSLSYYTIVDSWTPLFKFQREIVVQTSNWRYPLQKCLYFKSLSSLSLLSLSFISDEFCCYSNCSPQIQSEWGKGGHLHGHSLEGERAASLPGCVGWGPVVVLPWIILVLVGGSQVVKQHFLQTNIDMPLKWVWLE